MTMECKLKNRNELITKYLSEELSEDEMKTFEEHYFHCEQCFNELRISESVINLIKQEGPSAFDKNVVSNQKIYESNQKKYLNWAPYKRWGIAAALTSVLLFIFIITNQNDEQKIPDDISAFDRIDSLKANDTVVVDDEPEQDMNIISYPEEILADLTSADFVENSYLEEWINESIRSGGSIVDSVLSPRIGEKFTDQEIVFKWMMNNDETVYIKIIDNRESEIIILKPEISQYPEMTVNINPETFEKSGLYYWRIENENEVFFVGKFYYVKRV